MDYMRYIYDWMTGKTEKDAMDKVIQGNNYFAFKFYQGMTKEKKHGGDILFSPAVLQIILGILWVGAADNGLKQIEEALQLPPDRSTIIHGFKALFNHLLTLKFVIMNIATRIYTPSHVRLKRDFYVACGRHFQVRIKPTNFHTDEGPVRDSINEWVKKNTMNKVDQIIKRQHVDDCTQILIVNGVNFEGNMSIPFLACDTTTEIFRVTNRDTRTVKFLNQIGMYRYIELDELQVRLLELPYKSPTVSLLIMLPYTVEGLRNMEAKLPTLKVLEILQQMHIHRVQATIPKFRLLEGFDASDHLYEVGIDSLMDLRSNALQEVSEHDPPLTLTHLWQKTFFELIEEGIDPIQSGIVQLPEETRIPTKIFRADHPFVFMVVDKVSGLIILLGRVTCKDRFDVSMLRTQSGSKLLIPDMSRGSWVTPPSQDVMGQTTSDDESQETTKLPSTTIEDKDVKKPTANEIQDPVKPTLSAVEVSDYTVPSPTDVDIQDSIEQLSTEDEVQDAMEILPSDVGVQYVMKLPSPSTEMCGTKEVLSSDL